MSPTPTATAAAVVLIVALAASPGRAQIPFAPGHMVVTDADGVVAVYDMSRQLVEQFDVTEGSDNLRGPALGPDGLLYACGYEQDEVRVYDATGAHVGTYDAEGTLDGPTTLAFGPDGLLHVVDTGSRSVLVLDADDAIVRSIGGDADLAGPEGVAFGPDGRLVVTDPASLSLRTFDRRGTEISVVPVPVVPAWPIVTTRHPDDTHLLLTLAHGIIRMDEDGASLGAFSAVNGLDMAWGPDGHLWVATGVGSTVAVIDATGATIDTLDDDLFFTNGVFATPTRLRARVRGSGAAANDPLGRLKDTDVTLALWPGDGTIAVDWDDEGELAALFGVDAWWLRGFVQADPTSTKRQLWSASAPGLDPRAGAAALTLTLRGKPLDDGTWQVKKASGVLQRGARSGAASAKLTTAGPAKD